MRWVLLAGTAAIVAAAGCADTGTGRSTAPATGAAMSAQQMNASSFAAMAASSGMFEVMSSQLALTRATQPQVRSFAQQMIQDHDRANRELMAVAGANNIQMPQRMMDRHQRMMDDLSAASPGPAFDRQYVQQQRLAHDEAVALFSGYSQAGENMQVREFARRTLPVLQMHQQMVQSMAQ